MLVVAAVDSDIIGMPVSSNDWKEYFLKNGNRYELSGRVVGKRVGGAGRKPSIDSVPLPQRLKGIREKLLENKFLTALRTFLIPLGME